jgi:hypothetical protein
VDKSKISIGQKRKDMIKYNNKNHMEENFFKTAKIIIVSLLMFVLGIFLAMEGYSFAQKFKRQMPAPNPTSTISRIEISSDAKAILNVETKDVIFTIGDAQKYLKNSGYFYNPDTFQTTNAKYAGDCFLSAALSNNKDRIVFSTGCLPGDLPQAWVGIRSLIHYSCPPPAKCDIPPKFHFLTSGSGRNFTWSQDDKTITYEADLGLSGMTETKTIDSVTGEILGKKDLTITELNNPISDWTTYKPTINPKYPSKDLLKFEFKYPSEWYYNESGIAKCKEEPDRMNPYCRYDALYVVFGNNKENLDQEYFSFLPTTAVIIAGGKGSTSILCSGHNNIEFAEIKKISGKEWYIYKYQDLEDVLFYNRSALGSGVTNYCNEFIDFMAISSNKETKSTVEKILETLKFN